MVTCYLLKDDRVLLGRRKRVSFGLGKNLVSGIGGKVGDQPGFENETYDDAAKRETLEEIGVTLRSFHHVGDITCLFPARPKWNQRIRLYVVHRWDSEPQETDAIEPIWYPIDELPFDRMWGDAPHYLPLILHGEQIEATFTYAADNETIADWSLRRVTL